MRAFAFNNGANLQRLDPFSMARLAALQSTSCFAASGALLAPGSSSHVGVNSCLGVSHSRSSLSDLSDSDVPMTPSPLDITGCTVGHSIRAGCRWLVLLILLAPDLSAPGSG